LYDALLLMAWGVVFLKKKQAQLRSLDRRELLFIALSSLENGASWPCCCYATPNGVVSMVIPIDGASP